MTTLDQTVPLSAERRAEIQAKIERAHTEVGEVSSEGPSKRWRMHVPADPARDTDLILSDALTGAEVLLAEVDRLNAYVGTLDRLNKVADGDWQREVDRLKARVGELTSLLNDPDRLADHLVELRAVFAEAERDAEIDRLADGGEV